jgi:superfamily I DNA/RNA helicase
VDRKADADCILGTCHKAKGTEEDYVQLSDDFVTIADGKDSSKPVDEYNLLYVAATRAKLALICNKDVQKMLLRASELRPVLVEVCTSVAVASRCTCC